MKLNIKKQNSRGRSSYFCQVEIVNNPWNWINNLVFQRAQQPFLQSWNRSKVMKISWNCLFQLCKNGCCALWNSTFVIQFHKLFTTLDRFQIDKKVAAPSGILNFRHRKSWKVQETESKMWLENQYAGGHFECFIYFHWQSVVEKGKL